MSTRGRCLGLLCLAVASCLLAMGCSRAADRVVVVHLSEPNELTRGVLRVATNEPILCVVDGTQQVLRVDCGGMLLIPERDWVAMVELLRRTGDGQGR